MTVIDSLPLFPLSDVVLLPDSSVPLFIFEPRYRQLMREALEGAQQIGRRTTSESGNKGSESITVMIAELSPATNR